MSDQNKIAQMLEHLVNDNQEKAEELFHEYVVERSREIYENLIENELDLDEVSDEKTDDLLADVEDEEVDESEFVEADDEEGEEGEEAEMDMDMDMDAGDEAEMGGEEGDSDEPATKGDIADLSDAIKELEDELAKLVDAEAGEEEMKDSFDTEVEELDVQDLDSFESADDLETVREYVEKVPAGHGAEKKGAAEAAGANTKSTVAGKNDMGGTAANIVAGGEGSDKGTAGGLLNPSTKEENAGNVNVPGSKNATKLNSVAKGHGAEKAGAKEDGGVNKTSLFRK